MLAEYAATYGGPPPPDLPWIMFLHLTGLCSRFDARKTLHAADGTQIAAMAVLGEGASAGQARDEILQASYPIAENAPRFVELNMPSSPPVDSQDEDGS